MEEEQEIPQLTVVIGANGAGKTTWAYRSRGLLPKPFYDADSIAEGLGDANSAEFQRQARHIVDEAIAGVLTQRRSFGFESTYSGTSRPAIVERAKRLGYSTHGVFIGTAHHEINVARVRKRVEAGGHDIPANEIVRRWKAAQENLLRTWDSFDMITIVDNSGSRPETIAEQRGPTQDVKGMVPKWANALLARGARATAARTRE